MNSLKLEIDAYKLSEERYVRVTLVDYYETTCKMHRWHCVSDNDPGYCMRVEKQFPFINMLLEINEIEVLNFRLGT